MLSASPTARRSGGDRTDPWTPALRSRAGVTVRHPMSLIPGYVPFEYDVFTARGPLRKEDLPAIRKTYRRFAAMRAEVLERALEVEYDLVKVIVHGLHGRDYPRHRLLRALVF